MTNQEDCISQDLYYSVKTENAVLKQKLEAIVKEIDSCENTGIHNWGATSRKIYKIITDKEWLYPYYRK